VKFLIPSKLPPSMIVGLVKCAKSKAPALRLPSVALREPRTLVVTSLK
jgi:hypothetical protein